MRRFGILVNIANGFGNRKERRLRAFEDELRKHGAETRIFRTSKSGVAGGALQAARLAGCDALLAAGGDGTFNDLLQASMAAGSDLPLAVLPFGSGNILAQELHKGSDRDIASQLLTAQPRPVAIGKMTSETSGGTVIRYFAVAAGVGADARVICGINPRHKIRFGIAAYYVESARQLLFDRNPLPEFQVRFSDSDSGQIREEQVTQVVVERVSYFGRCLAGRNGHGLLSEAFRLVLFKTNRRSAFLAYGARLVEARFSTAAHPVRDVEIAHAREVTFMNADRSPAPVLTEVDGEPVGQLPAHIELVHSGVRMMIPGVAHARS